MIIVALIIVIKIVSIGLQVSSKILPISCVFSLGLPSCSAPRIANPSAVIPLYNRGRFIVKWVAGSHFIRPCYKRVHTARFSFVVQYWQVFMLLHSTLCKPI